MNSKDEKEHKIHSSLGVFMASEMAEPKTEPTLFGSVWFYVKKSSINRYNRNNRFFIFYFNFSKYLLKIYTNLI